MQPVPPAHALWRGPYSFPRSNQMYGGKRPHAGLEEFLGDQGGGEGVMKLLKARKMADESWGYEWIHTVLVWKGRSLPTLPTFIIMAWTVLVTIVLMSAARFDNIMREDYGVLDIPVKSWQRDLYIYMKGLEVWTARFYSQLNLAGTQDNYNPVIRLQSEKELGLT
jgi:hypothetical protein